MNILKKETTLHPLFLDSLFAYQRRVSSVFKDVLGLYDIDYMSISHINLERQLLTFSSTPSLEYNLFSKDLWRFDLTYQCAWYEQYRLSPWTALYTASRYDDLYDAKQVRHDITQGLSFAVKLACADHASLQAPRPATCSRDPIIWCTAHDDRTETDQHPSKEPIAVSQQLIYSIATHGRSEETAMIFAHEYENFYKIGEYCSHLLRPIFEEARGLAL